MVQAATQPSCTPPPARPSTIMTSLPSKVQATTLFIFSSCIRDHLSNLAVPLGARFGSRATPADGPPATVELDEQVCVRFLLWAKRARKHVANTASVRGHRERNTDELVFDKVAMDHAVRYRGSHRAFAFIYRRLSTSPKAMCSF